MSCQNINGMNQQSLEQEHAQFNPIDPDHTDSFSANFEQRRYLHEASSLERRTLWNSSSSSCCQPLKHHSKHGEPLYRSLLKPHHCSQSSFMDYVEGVHHRHHKQYLFESENAEAGNCFSPQCMHYNPCRCGSPMVHESNTRTRSLAKGQSYYPNRALPNEITLYSWYLIRSGDSHTSDIAVGGFLSSRGTEVEKIETTTIVKRLEECKLLTKDGDVINLVGPIDDYRTVSNGFTLQTAHLFISGFPHIWNLLVGMGLPAKAAGTVTSSQSCDFHGGEVTFQERLWKETSGQRGRMQHSSAFEGLGEDLVFYPEGGRKSGATQGMMKESPVVEADGNIVESAALPEQDNSLLIGECQSKEDFPLLHDGVQEKDSDKKAGLEGNCAEGSHDEASHGQISTASELAEATDLACELDNMPVESVKAAVSETAFGNKECQIATENNVENGAKEKYHANQAFVEATADASAEADTISGGNLVVPSQMTEGELGKAKSSKVSCKASPKKRKVAFSTANVVEGGDPSCASLTLETSTTSMQKSCSLLGQKEEDIISPAMSIENQKGVVAKKTTAKKKGRHKRRGRVLLVRSKRSTKPKLAEATDRACEPENMAIESVEAAVSEIALGNKDFEIATKNNVESGAKEKDHDNQAFAEATVDAGVEADKISGENLELASVQSSQMNEGELGTAKSSKSFCKSSPKKRKVAFNTAKDVEGGDPSCASPSLETSTKSREKSSHVCSQKEEELFPSVINIEKQEGIVAKKEIVRKKGRHKRRGKVLLARSKRSSKSKVQIEFKRRADAIQQLVDSSQVEEPDNRKNKKLKEGQVTAVAKQDPQTGKTIKQFVIPNSKSREDSIKQIVDSSQVEDLDAVPKNRKIRKLKEGQVTAVSEQDPRAGKTVKQAVNPILKRRTDAIKHLMDSSQVDELEISPKYRKIRKLKEGQVTAVTKQDPQTVLNPMLVMTRRQGSIQKLKEKKGVRMTSIAKQEGNKSKNSITQTALRNMQGNGSLLSWNSLKKEKRGRSRGPDPGLQLDTSDGKEAEESRQKFETLEVECSSCNLEISKQIFIGKIHDGNASSSARKRMKQMLPPPLPSPLMSVPKQLVSKAFGLKTSKSGRLLVPPLAHWRGQSLVRDMDGGIIAIEDGSQGTPLETGCFNFKPPIEARAKKLQEWLSVTATKCLTKRLNARRKRSQPKTVPK